MNLTNIKFALPVVALTGCTLGLQQVAVAPPISARTSFSGVDLTARTPPDANGTRTAFDVQMPAATGRTGLMVTATQLMLGFDLPFLRMSIAPALWGQGEDAVYAHFDLLYKHQFGGDRSPWRALLGISALLSETYAKQTQTLTLAQPLAVDNAILQTGDTIEYQATEMHSAFALAGGAEYEIRDWAHAFLLANLSLGEDVQRGQDLRLIARQGSKVDSSGNREPQTFHLLTDTRFDVQFRQNGTFTSNLALPTFTLLVGIAVTFPTFGFFRSKPPAPALPPSEPEAYPPAPGPEHPPLVLPPLDRPPDPVGPPGNP